MRRRLRTRVALAAALAVLGLAVLAGRVGPLLNELPQLVADAESGIASRLKSDGVLAYWDFDDVWPRERVGRTGCVNAGTRLVSGRTGSARRFLPREHGLIRTALRLDALGNRFSFSCWLSFPEQIPDDQQVFQYLGVRDGKLALLLPGQEALAAATAIGGGRIFHAAFTVDGAAGRARLYIDGAPAGELALRPLWHLEQPLSFGQVPVSPPPSFTIDEAAIWDRTLAAEEVGQLSRLNRPLAVDRAFSGIVRLRLAKAAHDSFRAVLLAADLFNPFLHESRVHAEGVSSRQLVMSRNDVKYFTRYFNEQQGHGLSAPGSSQKRRIELLEGDRTVTAAMELLSGEPSGPEGSAKKAFTLETLTDDGEPERKTLVRPIEGTPYLLDILTGMLARDCGLPAPAPELCAVSVNGTFEGLHLCTEVAGGAAPFRLASPDARPALLRRLPVFRDDALGAFDRLAASLDGALTSDRKSPLTSREVLHDIKAQRRLLERELPEGTGRTDETLVALVAEWLGEDFFLGDNPHPSLVIGNLDFSTRRINGAELSFQSLAPAVLGSDGRVNPPADQPTPVEVRLTIGSGRASRTRTLSYVILPARRRLGILRVASAGNPPEGGTVTCRSELIEGDGRRSLLPEGKIRLRGNTSLARARNQKKYYRIALERPHDVPGIGRTRRLFLTSGWKDPTLLRDRLAYDLYRDFSEPGSPRYSPRVRPVELVLNGDYRGIYNLMERVDGDLLELGKDTRGVDGPVLYKAVDTLASFHTPHREAYLQKIPDWRDGEHWGPYEDLVSFVGRSTPAAFREGVARVLDVDNIIDFEIILTLTSHLEGQNFNLFIARPGGPGARFFIVPWDFDMAFYNTEAIPTNHLIRRLHRDLPGHGRRVLERWQQLRRDRLSEQGLLARVAALEGEIAEGVERNYRRWPLAAGTTVDGENARLRSFLTTRLARLDARFKTLGAARQSPRHGPAVHAAPPAAQRPARRPPFRRKPPPANARPLPGPG